MNKIKQLISLKSLLIIAYVFGTYFIIVELDNYNDFYIEKKSNYSELKLLWEKTVTTYNIDYSDNKEINELSKKINYDEHMLASQEPNTKFIKYYWWFYVILGWSLILLSSNYLKRKTT